jgi:predicted exporter
LAEPATSSHRLWRCLAIAWLLAVLAVAAHQWHFWSAPRIETDVLALLPQDENAPVLNAATRKLSEQASRQVVVAIGAAQWADTQRAAAAWRRALPADAGLAERRLMDAQSLKRQTEFLAPWRDRLLTPAQREALAQKSTAQWAWQALSNLMQPGASGRLTEWSRDPLALWAGWWAGHASDVQARARDGEAALSHQGLEWVVMVYELDHAATRLDGELHLATALAQAEAVARQQVADLRVLRGGVPLHAEAAAASAHREINTIGWGSLAAVMLLMWLAFRSAMPLLLTATSLLVGVAVAGTVTILCFGQIHLVTLIFGATLIGVAEDYGIHYFSARQTQPGHPPLDLMQHLLPGLLLALATSVLGYLVLGLAPFQGLRQMAVFSATGLVATFLTAWAWFPWLDRGRAPRTTVLAERVSASLPRWPRWRRDGRGALLAVALLALVAFGASRWHTQDDLRQLQSGSPQRFAEQRELSQALGLPSPVQLFLVTGASADEVLQREEALKQRLAPLVAAGRLKGWQALSDWVPSAARQQADAALTARVETAVVAALATQLDEPLQRTPFAQEPLTLDAWLAQEAAKPLRGLWLGRVGEAGLASVVMLRGAFGPADLPVLAAAAEGLPGVRWSDRTAETSALLGHYRVLMGWLLLVGHLAVLGALAWRFGRDAWRAWLPTVLATLLTVTTLAALGQPFNLFHELALLLLLGVGVDYGVFLLEHPDDGGAWLAVIVGALSTGLSFGLLGLSQLPALRAFGITVLMGLAWVLLLAPLMRLSRPQAALQEQEPLLIHP